MPSVRPKLVQEGAPIEGKVDTPEDYGDLTLPDSIAPPVVNGGSDNLFVIGAPAPAPTNKQSSLQASSSSLMNASASSLNVNLQENPSSSRGATTTSNSSRRRSSHNNNNNNGGGGKRSSLARAAKGTLMDNSKTTKKTVVQTSFVIGGGGGGKNSSFSDEKKSADSPYMDDSSRRGTGGRRSSRTTTMATSFQVPDNGNAITNLTQQTLAMELDPKPSTATKFVVVGPTSSSQAPSYIEEQAAAAAVAAPPEPMDHISTTNPAHTTIPNTTMTENTTTSSEIIPADPTNNIHQTTQHVEKMEGVIDLSDKAPMVVIDGANVAYAYDKAATGGMDKPEPDARGIVVACDYFVQAGIRVLAVIPSTWMHRDPYQRILKQLDRQGLVVSAPSRDDDDAYAITIARREDAKSKERSNGSAGEPQYGPGYVLSNDMFRDAMLRGKAQGGGADLVSWLMQGSTREGYGETGPGRISFTFCDTGAMDDHGDKVLDIVPNPRHPLIVKAENGTLLK